MIQLDVKELPEHAGVLIGVTGKIDTQGTETLREQVREYLDDVNLKHIRGAGDAGRCPQESQRSRQAIAFYQSSQEY